MTDNRTNEPTEAQVEAAAKAMHETRNPWFAAYGDWGAAGFEIKQAFRESARAALVAAQGAAPVPVVDESTPSEDDLALKIAHEIAKMHTFTTVDALSIANAALALSAPPILTQQGPSDEQVEAAAHALWAGHGLNGEWESGTHEMHEDCREDARNALIAAASVAAQPLDNTIHDRIQPRTQPEREAWDDGFHSCRCAAPVLPSSGVDEDALAEVIGSLDWGYMVDGPSVREIARAVAEWLKGRGCESSGG